MYSQIIEKIKNVKTYFLLKKKNKIIFSTKNKNNKIILIEYNNYRSTHLCQALLSNFLKKKNFGKIVAYYNYTFMVTPLRIGHLQKFKWQLSCFLNLGIKGIYRSFGVDRFIRPETDNKYFYKAKIETKKFFKKNPNNSELVNYKINNILIGDLLYDTYLKSKLVPTINIKDKNFYLFFREFLELFFYWEDYFKKNNVVSTIGVHSCYSFGIPLRISIHNKIPSYVINSRGVMMIDKNISTMYGSYKFYSKDFSKFFKKYKRKCLKIAKVNLDLRLGGRAGVDVGLFNRVKSSFSNKINRSKILQNNSKIKILICTHDFLDSVHVNGKNFFPDFNLWISYLGELSNIKSKEYDFYIKNHPAQGNKYEKYQKYTHIFVDRLIKKYPKIKKIPDETSHKKIISEGIKFVLTVYGSVGIEYAALGIPVINASINNPHINYNFNINPSSLKNYKMTLNNLDNIKLKIKKDEIYECYFMKHFFHDENWLFDNYKQFLNKVSGFQNIHTNKFYEYWIDNFEKKDVNKSFSRIEKFINNRGYRMSIIDTKKDVFSNHLLGRS